jgi:3-hydroxyisobutyrate dehydrogenase-like beta-hydroxyacid dehydrogenase
MAVKVGFIGTGNMGLPMAHRLIDHGYSLSVFNRSRNRAISLIERGALTCESAADLASEASIVLVCLPTPEVVREVALGSYGIAEGSEINTYVDLSTTGPRTAAEVSNELGRKGISVIDAPVSGGVAGAERGTLTFMVSGPSDAYQQIQPIFSALGKNIFYIGEKPGLAQMMKLINNLLSATAMIISSEAFVLGAKAGLDAEVMLKVINSSSGRNSATEDKFPKAVIPRTFESGFKTDLMYKDLKLCLEEAEALRVPMWVANTVRQICAYAISQSGGSRDFSTIIQYIESWAKVQVGGA